MPHALDTDRHWTADDLDQLDVLLEGQPRDVRYECLDGALIPLAPSLPWHQKLAQRLLLQLHPQLPDGWDVLFGCGVRLGPDWRMPDLLVVPDRLVGGQRLFDPARAPLLVEVASVSSRRTDRIVKPAEYADAGIPYYWRVEVEPRVAVHAYVLHGNRYADPLVFAVGSVRPPAPFPLVVDVDALGAGR